MSTSPPPLPVDLEVGLRRLRLGAMRALSPELLVVAKTQRWKPEEFLRTLVEAEIASRDASNARGRDVYKRQRRMSSDAARRLKVTSSIRSGGVPSWSRRASRLTRVRVLPVPAPAMIRRGPPS